ncbi:HAD-IIIC family phosphatase [Acidocella aromatica]|uniref:FkbH-like protein n=1 Tax=Acidocella aromatica TaxID=1303579 RepID=A0A840VAE9_9PROT|nr:HAD-IIIC family phosphatase [Acidocella aromatica]MBB5372743.1 FkbH-like protein [Acidocella aromatica]
MPSLIDPLVLRVPAELEITALTPRRALIIGSCLSEALALRMKSLPEPCESDLFLQGTPLPEQPPQPVEAYDFQLVQLGLRFALPDSAFARLGQMDVEGHERLFDLALANMRRAFAEVMRWNQKFGILTFVIPYLVPMANAVGRLLPRYDLRNPVYFVEKLNEAMAREMAAYKNAYWFDLNEIHSFYGRRFVQEDVYSALNHGSFISDFDYEFDQNRLEPSLKATEIYEEKGGDLFGAAWRELVAMLRSVRQQDAVKLVAVDLDDTLWRGIAGETDNDAMPTTEGWPKGLWEALLFLKRRGILLAIISKAEESVTRAAWERIVGRNLKLEDFAAWRINWNPKPQSLAEIMAEVNVLPGNVLYVDDSPVERAAIKAAFPEVRVLGGTPLTWRRLLLWAAETQRAEVTAESAQRTEMVQAQIQREQQRQAMTRDEFLASLKLHMKLFTISDVSHPRFSRALELINKTNQFNTTGKRWTLEEAASAFAAGSVFHVFELADIYTDYGLVGVLITTGNRIGQFVMSCRVLGLGAEVAAVAEVVGWLRRQAEQDVFADMEETPRNLPCRHVYAGLGFSAAPGGWVLANANIPAVPAHIQFVQDEA